MAIVIRGEKILGDIAYEVARLKQLTADLDRLGGGVFPDPEVIGAAPRLDNWSLTSRPVCCLVGECTDHPRLSGPLLVTSDVWITALELGWCRTLGRYYRLGKPQPHGDGA
jgi:hypothetical protein